MKTERKLFRVKFRTTDRPAPLGLSVIEVVANGQADAICRAGLDLDDLGVREWALESCEAVPS